MPRTHRQTVIPAHGCGVMDKTVLHEGFESVFITAGISISVGTGNRDLVVPHYALNPEVCPYDRKVILIFKSGCERCHDQLGIVAPQFPTPDARTGVTKDLK
jgi:hypothetical protein